MNTLINTPCGKIQGNEKEPYNEWLGIKYANANRFEDPEIITYWNGVYDATKFGPRSLQYKGIFGHEENLVQQFYSNSCLDEAKFNGYNEDSLNLNIYAPKDAKACPVLFYIHGGGYSTGCNSAPDLITGSFAKESIVTVVCNYRLAVFATAYIDNLTGNYAVKDQIAALTWTYNNIAAFGGDPNRITICGESAGAYSVQNLLNTPKIPEEYIHSAIMMSGAGDTMPLELLLTKETQSKIWEAVKVAAKVSKANELKTLPADILYKIWTKEAAKHAGFYSSPNIDGDIIPFSTKTAIEKGRMKNVPLLLGMLSEDMWPYYLYRGICSIADARKAQNGAPVYSYLFDCKVDEKYGAYHAADIPYAFNTIELRESVPSEINKTLRDDLFSAFCSFIKEDKPKPISSVAGSWLSMQEADNKFYELNGVDHKMIHPDIEQLKKQTKNAPAFPTADFIK